MSSRELDWKGWASKFEPQRRLCGGIRYRRNPNPFNPSTVIEYTVPMRALVKIDVYNVLGQKVRALVNETRSAGTYKTEWNGIDDAGKPAATGVYFYRLQADRQVAVKKMVLVK